jgi:hypothetical protein
MRNLDPGIAEWRREMAAAGIKSAEVLDELESHLHERSIIRNYQNFFVASLWEDKISDADFSPAPREPNPAG